MKKVPVLMLVAWAVFVSSWFLPVASGGFLEPATVYYGWRAFLIALRAPQWGDGWLFGILSICSGLSNGLMLLSGVLLLRRRPSQWVPGWLTLGFVVAVAVDLVWVWLRAFLEVGYWLWLASFALGAIALSRMRRRQAR